MYVYIYIYVCVYIYICICIYMYIYIYLRGISNNVKPQHARLGVHRVQWAGHLCEQEGFEGPLPIQRPWNGRGLEAGHSARLHVIIGGYILGGGYIPGSYIV